MQTMESGMIDVRQCSIKMELSLQKLVSDSKTMQQMVKQSLAKPSTGAAGAAGGASAKTGSKDPLSVIGDALGDASRKLVSGVTEKLLKMAGLDTSRKDKDDQDTGQKNGTGQSTPDFSALMASPWGKYLQWNESSLNEMFFPKDNMPFDKDRDSMTDLFKSGNTNEALQKTVDNSKQASEEIAKAMQGGLKQTETALTNFVKTGKLSFADLTRSILADIAQIMIKMAVSKLIGFIFPAASSSPVPARSAAGGYDIPSGENPLTQLHEKEMVLPAQYADVIRGLANNGSTSSGGININTSVSVASDGTASQQNDAGGSSQRQLANMINDQTKAVIAREMRQGGLIWNMRMGVA